MKKLRFLIPLLVLAALLVSPAIIAWAQTPQPRADATKRPKNNEFIDEFVEPRVRQQATIAQQYLPAVKDFVKNDAANLKDSPLTGGSDNPGESHEEDKKLLKKKLEEFVQSDEHDPCFDMMYVLPCGPQCLCHDETGQVVWKFIHEYWFPVAKVEVVNVPHKSGYLSKGDVQSARGQLDSLYPDQFAQWKQYELDRFTTLFPDFVNGKMRKVGFNEGSGPDASKMKVDDSNGKQAIQDARKAAQQAKSQSGMYSGGNESDRAYVDYHVMAEPYARNELYWSKEMANACHYNLPYTEGSGGEHAPDKKEMYLSDFPDGTGSTGGNSALQYSMTRDPLEKNLQLTGRDVLRPGMEYDHLGAFFNGGYPAMMIGIQRQPQNIDLCTENYLDRKEQEGVYFKGRTPVDQLLDAWTARETKVSEFLKSGCLRKNLGSWVPTRQYAQVLHHTGAAMVGAMRGLKLAYYYFPPDSVCKGFPMFDSWGYCYIPGYHSGTHYDFEPEAYTMAMAPHVSGGIDPEVFGNFSQGALAADKVLWSKSEQMPKVCIGLIKFFDEIEKFAHEEWGGDLPNKVEVPKSSQGDDPQNVAIAWRFFRSCPKDMENGQFAKIPGTNTARCCMPCCMPACPFPCCPFKRL